MLTSLLGPFERPDAHRRIAQIIRRRSTNATDVREVALAGLDLSAATEVLDLGCGFGFMAEALAPRVAPDARLTGVDYWPSNERPFLEQVAAGGRHGRFVCAAIGAHLPWPDRTFDLVVCSYSLYFFVEVLPEVARVLTPGGTFVALTHCEDAFGGLLRAAGVAEADCRLCHLIGQFSRANGDELLRPWFGQIERVAYPNALRFACEHEDDLIEYVRFKLPLLLSDARLGEILPDHYIQTIRTALRRDGAVLVEKDDVAFRCREPRWR